jgi:hypothetical protein
VILLDAPEQAANLGRIGMVELDRNTHTAAARDLLGCVVNCTRSAIDRRRSTSDRATSHVHRGPCVPECQRDTPPAATAGASDDGNPPCESSRRFTSQLFLLFPRDGQLTARL